MRILVTGFGKFPGVAVNTSELVVSRFAADAPGWPFDAMRFEVLPTRYEAAEVLVRELMGEFKPDRVLLLGVAETPTTARLERFALNIDDAASPDEGGVLRKGVTILAGGPAAFATAVDLQRLLADLLEAGVRAEISNHAGSYVCNHVYYTALSEAVAAGAGQVLFMHVPRLPVDNAAGDALVAEVARACGIVARALARPQIHMRETT